MINGEAGLAVAAPVVNGAEVPVTPINASGVVEEQPAVAEDVVALIDGIVLDPVKAKSHVTAGGVSLERLRAIAVMLQLPKSLGKGPLIDSIVAKRKRMRELAALQMRSCLVIFFIIHQEVDHLFIRVGVGIWIVHVHYTHRQN